MRRTYKRGNAGALCLTGAESSALTGEKDSASSASVCAFAARGSLGGTEWIQSNVMKLRRECGCSGVMSRGT